MTCPFPRQEDIPAGTSGRRRYQLMSEAAAIEQRIKVAKDPQEVEELQKKLAEIRKKIEKVYGKGEKAEGD